ncbi:MAG: MBOAT family protein, partial [Lachnospiraceae bacterium]|nr:MBOAT family protein [Lachnospiraceae bacterium]
DVQTKGVLGINTPIAWLGAWSYSFQLLFDFAGYSMMAIGLGRILGFYLPMNFLDPYTSKSATEFWRNWHVTLGRWFRQYVYIPLGGNRKGKARMILNLFITWALTGLWHGASWNFVLWGLMFFVILMIEKLFLLKYLDKSKVLGHLYMFILIPVSWMVFAINDIESIFMYIKRMFFIPIEGTVEIDGMKIFVEYVQTYWWLFALCIVCATSIPMKLIDKFYDKFITKLVLVVLFWICVYYLLTSSTNPFLYAGF